MVDRRVGAILRAYAEVEPRLHESVWVAPGAAVIGDVEIGPDSSVFYAAVLRGDVERIRIGARTNIQDHATQVGSRRCWATRSQWVIARSSTAAKCATVR